MNNKSKAVSSAPIGKDVGIGEVWTTMIDELCPILILSHRENDEICGMRIVASAGEKGKGFLAEVHVGAEEGLKKDSVLRVAYPIPGRIMCSWLLTLRPAELIERLGHLSVDKLQQVDEILKIGGISKYIP